jgi:hypothetical protein
MILHSPNKKTNKDAAYLSRFISAHEELADNRRKLFGIPLIDDFFHFHEKKYISIINRCKTTTHLSYHLVAKLCIEFSKNNGEKNKTILIDGGGNNLGYLYVKLTKLSVKEQFNINQLLDNMMISRAFTFYQLTNVIINELPILIRKLNGKLQIIVLDMLNTLVNPSTSKTKSKSIKNVSDIEEDKIKCLEEILQNIISLSKYYFSILVFTDFKKTFNKNIFSGFDHMLEIVSIYSNKNKKNEPVLQMKTASTEKSLILDDVLESV